MIQIRSRIAQFIIATLVAAAAVAVFATESMAQVRSTAAKGAPVAVRPPIRHVFVLVLENQGYDTTFGKPARAPYLTETLRKRGALLRNYYGIGHFSLDNYIAMISGLAPNHDTQVDCPRFVEFAETGVAPHGQPIGVGCVLPAHVKTIANQLEAKGLRWKGYMEDMGNDPKRESATCGHPVIGSVDSTERATRDDQYATKHDPFVYFHSLLDSESCKRNVVPLTQLEIDLQSASTTPNFAFITPSLCHDGHDRPCKNGEPGSLESANTFLEHWVPVITKSAAFRKDGLLIITFDEALSIDARACCDEPSGPNTKAPGVNGPGGGRIGAVLLSPFIKPGTVSTVPYNHYSMLRSVEDMFGLDHLGYAGQKGLATFGRDVYR